MSETRTITTSSSPGDSTVTAQKVAENLRAAGRIVTVGPEYDNVTVRRYGMRSVDLTIEDAPTVTGNFADAGFEVLIPEPPAEVEAAPPAVAEVTETGVSDVPSDNDAEAAEIAATPFSALDDVPAAPAIEEAVPFADPPVPDAPSPRRSSKALRKGRR